MEEVLFNKSSMTQETFLKIVDKDDLTKDWLLISTPYPVVVILILYFLVIFKFGPAYMEKREPFELKTVMRIYDIIQIIGNIRIAYYPLVRYHNCIPYLVQISCSVPDGSSDEVREWTNAFLWQMWNFLVLKILDLLDTVFMILRKKNTHVTFLHVYHHSAMVFFTWLTMTYIKSYLAVIPGLINVIVHTIMYTYYFLATFGPPIEKYLWWKKHLTKLQLAQFAVILGYLLLLYLNNCPVSWVFTYIWVFNVFVILCLFINFYVKAYVMPTQTKKTEKKS